jgi:uncharacterized protein (DUF952 family)
VVTHVFKILSKAEWSQALEGGRFLGSAVDREDGYIHLSTADQAPDTARLHFFGRDDLVLVRLNSLRLGERLKWEPSRGGALFPHLYGALDCRLVEASDPIPLAADGTPLIASLLPLTP